MDARVAPAGPVRPTSPVVYVAVHVLAGLLGGLAGLAAVYLFFGTWPTLSRPAVLGISGSSLWGVIAGLGCCVPPLRRAWPAVPRIVPWNVALAFALPAFFPCLLWLSIRSLRPLLS